MGQAGSSAEEGPPTKDADPLAPYLERVAAEWIDYTNHLSEWAYLLVMGNSSDAFFRYVGIDEAYRAAGASLYTVETHIHNHLEVSLGELLTVRLQVLGSDAKRVHIAHRGIREDEKVIAMGEQMLIHVDTTQGRASAPPEDVGDRIAQLARAHAAMERPRWVGHVMRLPRT